MFPSIHRSCDPSKAGLMPAAFLHPCTGLPLSHCPAHRRGPALHSQAAGAAGFRTGRGAGFSEHNGMKLEISYRNTGRSPNTWKLNKASLNNPCIKEEVSGEIRKYLEANKNAIFQIWGDETKAIQDEETLPSSFDESKSKQIQRKKRKP